MNQPVSKPWWKFGHVWLVIAGPAVVVVASFITVYLAVTRPDPVIDDYYRKDTEINKTTEGVGSQPGTGSAGAQPRPDWRVAQEDLRRRTLIRCQSDPGRHTCGLKE